MSPRRSRGHMGRSQSLCEACKWISGCGIRVSWVQLQVYLCPCRLHPISFSFAASTLHSLLIGFSLDSVTSCLYYFGSVRKMDATGEHPIKQNKPDSQKTNATGFLHLWILGYISVCRTMYVLWDLEVEMMLSGRRNGNNMREGQ